MLFERAKTRRGFTLIELLIVIAIILILIAIALPNFMAARVRAVITQVRGELRTLAMAAESYAIDHQSQYPIIKQELFRTPPTNNWWRGPVHNMWDLSTPIPYVSRELLEKQDPFFTSFGDPLPGRATYHYVNREVELEMRGDRRDRVHYLFHSRGPDMTEGPHPDGTTGWGNGRYGRLAPAPYFDPTFQAWQYSATNGTKSNGDLIQAQF